MIRYGFQRLALLNSAGYRRAELPLDAAVSLIAPNNTGKTSLINAMQFLLIIDRRRMDFGAHDVDTSRRFYFPHNSAYILLEIALPASGTLVLGCVGKGVSHDYEYFAYQGELNLDDFRLQDGSQLQQPQLKGHMAGLGRLVFSYSPSEFSAALYGARRKLLDQEPDLTVFKLEHPSHAGVFQRILTRTLRLDRLRSGEVKEYLLAIFQRDLPDSNIDFKAEWDKAFAEVNADRAQYEAALRQKERIAELEKRHNERLELRGKLLHFRPLIERQLAEWEAHYREQGETLNQAIGLNEQEQSGLQRRDRELTEEQTETRHQIRQLEQEQKRQGELENRFALITRRGQLEEALAAEQRKLEEQTALVRNATSRGLDAIQRDLKNLDQERNQLDRELASLTDNLYLHLTSVLDEPQLERLNRALNRQAMTLPPGEFESDPAELRRWLEGDADHLDLPGLRLALHSLSPQHTQRTQEELRQRLAELKQQEGDLRRQLKAAQDMDAARREKARLEAQVREIEDQLRLFDELQTLKAGQPQRAARLAERQARLAAIRAELDGAEGRARGLRDQGLALQARLAALNKDHGEIQRLREQRRDHGPLFESLADLPNRPWIGLLQPGLAELAATLADYHADCRRLADLDGRLDAGLAELHAGGLTKFHFSEGTESEITRIVEFAAHLPQEAQALDRKARSAVVNVTASLRELRDGLLTFKSKMREFNRLINRRQLSDLTVFKIEPVDEPQLVEAIEQLISTAEKTGRGETFELFNHGSVLDDATLNRAKNLLIKEGEVRGCLRVEHFFRLEFIVGKAGRKEESFSDMDSAASNGTVLMAKLVTGLALLHLMQDKRHNVQAVCYLDEASSLDPRNQRSLIETAQEFGYALVFASPNPLTTARYCVPITGKGGHNDISRKSWLIIEPLESAPTAAAAA